MSDVPRNVTGALAIRNMDDLARVGNMLAQSGYFTDARDAAQCGVKVLAGLEMGFGAFASMSGIHIIQGRPAIGANLMAARVKSSGKYDFRVRQLDDDLCDLEFFQGTESIGRSTFSREDAKRAGTQNMGKFPRNMLYARAMSNGVKWYTPDVFLGAPVYTAEELGAETDEDGNVIDVPSRVEKPVERPALASPAPEPAPEVAAVPEAVGEPLAGKPQLDAITRELKKEDVSKGDALSFFRWFTKREIAGAAELTAREATAFLALVANGKFADSLAEFAVDTAGGPPEPDVSDLSPVEERPVEFDPSGSINRQARKGAVS